jgi:hypothetical protein
MTPWPGAGWQSACARRSGPALHAAGCPAPVPHISQHVALSACLIAAWCTHSFSCTAHYSVRALVWEHVEEIPSGVTRLRRASAQQAMRMIVQTYARSICTAVKVTSTSGMRLLLKVALLQPCSCAAACGRG